MQCEKVLEKKTKQGDVGSNFGCVPNSIEMKRNWLSIPNSMSGLWRNQITKKLAMSGKEIIVVE